MVAVLDNPANHQPIRLSRSPPHSRSPGLQARPRTILRVEAQYGLCTAELEREAVGDIHPAARFHIAALPCLTIESALIRSRGNEHWAFRLPQNRPDRHKI